MNADNLNKWLTLAANVGVVIGLVLLIDEIRQNSELVRAQIHVARSDVYSIQQQGLIDEAFYHSRIESSIRRLAPVWLRLRLHEPFTPEFNAEVERLATDAE